ncbi:MAG: 50S ribosomal protein L5, partial [Euryarchaeota archaeon TMED141]
MSESVNPMMQPRITKISVNIGVGEGGERLLNAEKVLELVTGVRPQRTLGRIQNRDLKVRQGAPIGCKVTMRDQERIMSFLKEAFWVRENTIPSWNFDRSGNLSFGI